MLENVCETKQIQVNSENMATLLEEPAMCLKNGGLVAFPTETVYGLGADALNETAAARIYAAKGRPSDNPLIVHIANVSDMETLAYTNETAYVLAQAFWPGPLTIILPKKEIVPSGTTGGLDTVAIRMPSHPAALELIRKSGVFVAAPSANTSGRPSPTRADHVMEDMNGRIEYVVDGGAVGIGIESTIVDVSGEVPTILRPGFITKKMLENIIGTVEIDKALERPLDGFRPKAPGMKYTHYAPKGEMTLVESLQENENACEDSRVVSKIRELVLEKKTQGYRVGVMATKESMHQYKDCADIVLSVGERSKQDTIAAGLYAALRDFDAANVDYIFAESLQGDGLAYSIMNRLLKAAGHRVLKV